VTNAGTAEPDLSPYGSSGGTEDSSERRKRGRLGKLNRNAKHVEQSQSIVTGWFRGQNRWLFTIRNPKSVAKDAAQECAGVCKSD
jgi:hypothetical protein